MHQFKHFYKKITSKQRLLKRSSSEKEVLNAINTAISCKKDAHFRTIYYKNLKYCKKGMYGDYPQIVILEATLSAKEFIVNELPF